jgi:yecA family protein
MAKSRIDEALAALNAGGNDGFGARREVLERLGLDLLHRPALGSQIVARICVIAEPSPRDEGLLDLLGAGLDTARIARENGKARGQTLIDAVEAALELARGQGRMTSAHSLLFAQLWTRNAMPARAALALQVEDVVPAAGRRASNPAEGDALLEGLFAELIQQAEGEPLALHHALTESFAAMPPEMRDHVVAYSVGRGDPLHADMACYWLIDPAPRIRHAAAKGLADRLASGELPGRILSSLVVLRSWMPEDAARSTVDAILKDAMRKSITPSAEQVPWTMHSIRASLPDGGGAQSVGIALQSGSQRKMAMLLLKQGQGVQDAYTITCRTARDQKAIVERMTEEVGALTVTPDYVRRALSIGLADGLAQGKPPVPGLIEVVRLCGFAGLRPEVKSTPDLIADLASTRAVQALPPRQHGDLITVSEEWWDRHETIESWFEDSDAAHAVLDKARSAKSAETALWKWLETRRDWWARILARSADVLETANHPDAAGFAACAMALLEGRSLKTIPVMLDVHEQTIEAWVRDDPDFGPGLTFEELAQEAPTPEKKGEVAALLRGTELSVDWLDGYMTGVVIAPQMIMPNQWLPAVLEPVLPRINPSQFQRFMDLLMMRAQTVSDVASVPDQLIAAISSRSKKGQVEWWSGFSDAMGKFRSAWPKKGMTKEDKRLLEVVTVGMASAELAVFAALVALRQEKNLS